jgi:hypothetical protein
MRTDDRGRALPRFSPLIGDLCEVLVSYSNCAMKMIPSSDMLPSRWRCGCKKPAAPLWSGLWTARGTLHKPPPFGGRHAACPAKGLKRHALLFTSDFDASQAPPPRRRQCRIRGRGDKRAATPCVCDVSLGLTRAGRRIGCFLPCGFFVCRRRSRANHADNAADAGRSIVCIVGSWTPMSRLGDPSARLRLPSCSIGDLWCTPNPPEMTSGCASPLESKPCLPSQGGVSTIVLAIQSAAPQICASQDPPESRDGCRKLACESRLRLFQTSALMAQRRLARNPRRRVVFAAAVCLSSALGLHMQP